MRSANTSADLGVMADLPAAPRGQSSNYSPGCRVAALTRFLMS